jgi:hypothetical protein
VHPFTENAALVHVITQTITKMKNDDELSKKEKEELAQEYLFTALLTLGFDLRILQEFFNHITKVFKEQRQTLLESIDGGYRHRHYSDDCIKPVGQIGDYYIVKTADLVKPCRTSYWERDYLNTQTCILDLILRRVFWDDSWTNYREAIRSFDPSFISLKKNKDTRTIIQMASVQVLLSGRQMEEKHVTEFRRDMVPFWRKALETLRVELHLSGRPTYNNEIQQADSFLRILETSK